MSPGRSRLLPNEGREMISLRHPDLTAQRLSAVPRAAHGGGTAWLRPGSLPGRGATRCHRSAGTRTRTPCAPLIPPLRARKTTRHDANCLAAVGLAALTVVPERRAGKARRKPISMTAIRALLSHPGWMMPIPAAHSASSIASAPRITVGRFMNITRAVSLDA